MEALNLPAIQQTPEEGMPFELRTLLLGLWRRKLLLILFFLVSCVLGAVCGIKFGTQVWEAETTLLYKQEEEIKTNQTYPLFTRLNMVKVQPNLEETRKRLNLGIQLPTLGQACDVLAQKSSDLMIIRARWDSAEGAAKVANTLRNVFLENQRRIRNDEATNRIHDLEERLEQVRSQWKKANTALQEFTTTNEFIDLEKQTEGYLGELSAINLLLEQARIEKETNKRQIDSLGPTIKDLKERLSKEKGSSAEVETLGYVTARIDRLSKIIEEDREYRSRLAELTQRETELERARKLKIQGLISENAYDRIQMDYEKQKALTLDTDQIKQWKEEVTKLDKQTRPSKPDSGQSEAVLQEVLLKSFNLQLERAGLAEKVGHLEKAQTQVKAKLDALPKLHRKYVELNRAVTTKEEEGKTLEEMLAKAKRVYDPEDSGFTIISDAQPSVMPSKSNRRLLSVVVALLGTLMGLVVTFTLELLDNTIKSGAELSLKLSLPVLGALPEVPPPYPIFPGIGESVLIGPFSIMARRLRLAIPKKGARILIVSATHGEGKSLVITNLAKCLGQQEERVLLLDAQVRSEEGQPGFQNPILEDLISEHEEESEEQSEPLPLEMARIQDTIRSTLLPGVECLSQFGRMAIQELLGSNRVREVLEDISERFNLVLVESPPIIPYADAESLAQGADGILFVVQSRKCRVITLRKAIDRLKATGVPIVGAILNRVDPLYMEKE
jgi:Mrp family chromosome partitioning ATPase